MGSGPSPWWTTGLRQTSILALGTNHTRVTGRHSPFHAAGSCQGHQGTSALHSRGGPDKVGLFGDEDKLTQVCRLIAGLTKQSEKRRSTHTYCSLGLPTQIAGLAGRYTPNLTSVAVD
jgi:hypothetical protein